jgi:hypothetical protein
VPEEFHKIAVPKDIEGEVAIFVEQVKKAAAESGEFAQDDIKLITPESAGFVGPDLDAAIVYVALPVGIWITKAWLDKWVIPIILEKTDPHRFVRWVKNNFPLPDRGKPRL